MHESSASRPPCYQEIAGSRGAGRIAAELSSRGLELDIVLDEGGCILDDGLLPPLLGSPTALVAVAEKGYTSLELVLQATGGHAGIPPIDGTDLASSVGKLMRHVGAHKTPLKLQAPVTQVRG